MTDAETQTTLLRAILAEPEDDGAKLVLADWLEDRGDVSWVTTTERTARNLAYRSGRLAK